MKRRLLRQMKDILRVKPCQLILIQSRSMLLWHRVFKIGTAVQIQKHKRDVSPGCQVLSIGSETFLCFNLASFFKSFFIVVFRYLSEFDHVYSCRVFCVFAIMISLLSGNLGERPKLALWVCLNSCLIKKQQKIDNSTPEFKLKEHIHLLCYC